MRTSVTERARLASGRERHCAKCQFKRNGVCPYAEICHAAFVHGYAKGVADKTPGNGIATMLISPQQFDKEVWQTETGFSQEKYNAWLKSAIGSLENIYQQSEDSDDINPTDLYLLGDVINMLGIIKIIKAK